MRVQDLKDNYKVFDRGGLYHLYDPKEGSGKRSVYKYLCSIKKVGPTKFSLKGGRKVYSDFLELKKAIDKKIASYKYNSEYYDPNYRRGFFEELVVIDYLRELGFKSNWYGSGGSIYELDRPSVYGYQATRVALSFSNLDTMSTRSKVFPKEVTIYLHTGDWSWTEVVVKRNVDEIIKGIDSILKPLMIVEGVENILISEKLENAGDVDIMMSKFSMAVGVVGKDAKPELKKRLLEMADKL